MKAIILAAGTGSRMKDLTSNHPKCMLKLKGKTIIEHQINLLNKCGVNDIHVITGYKEDKIRDLLKQKCSFYYYPNFRETNNLYTLNQYINLLNEECLILFSDVLISEISMKNLLRDNSDFSLLVDISKCDESTMRIIINENKITDIGSHIIPKNGNGNFIGIAKYSVNAVKFLKKMISELCSDKNNLNDYYTLAISKLAKQEIPINYVDVNRMPWLEIDTEDEYKLALNYNFYV